MKIVTKKPDPRFKRQTALDSTYHCELSGRELFTLKIILDAVGGSPDNSMRMYAASMYNAIDESDLAEFAESISCNEFFESGHKENEIYFNTKSLDLMENGE